MRKLTLLLLLLVAAGAQATIGPPVQVRVLGEIPDFTPGVSRTVTLEITTVEALIVDMPQFSGRGWTIHSTDMPASKAMLAGQPLQLQVELSGSDPNELVNFSLFAGDEYFETALDFSADAAARSRGESMPARVEVTGMQVQPTPPTDADGGGGSSKAARNIRVFGRVYTTRPDGVNMGMPDCRVDIWENDVDPNPDDYITTGYTNDGGVFDITFYWDAVSEAEPDLYFTFWFESGNARVQDGNGNLYGYNTSAGTTWNYTGTFLDMGTWYPASGFEPVGFLYSHIHHGSEILWTAGGASQIWDTPKLNVQWFPGSTNGPDYSNNLFRMNGTRMWGEGVIHHEFGHHWHNSFATIQPKNYCNSICDSNGCGHCLWCNEDLGAAYNEGLANYMGELLTGSVAAVFGPSPYSGTGAELYNFETTVPNSSQCPSGHVPNPTINEGYFAALLRDITDSQNDNDPNVGSGVDQLSLSWDEILRTIDLDDPLNSMDFLAKFNARYNGFQAALVNTALNNGFNVSNSKANLAPYQPGGWAYAVVPQSANNTVVNSVPAPTSLTGNSNATYLNAAVINSGGFPMINGTSNYLQIDGGTQVNLTTGAMWNGSWGYALNLGPYNVRGGRHTQSIFTDATNAESESNEGDNKFGRQWTWSPLSMNTGYAANRSAPPQRDGGWDAVSGQTLWYNTDGYRLIDAAAHQVEGVAIRPLTGSEDYDLRMYSPSTGPTSGFQGYLNYSAAGVGLTDFVLVNYRVASAGDHDFGVVNSSGGSGQFRIEASGKLPTVTFGASGVHAIAANQLLQVGEVYTPVGQGGSTYLQVDVSPPGSPVRVAWYDAATASGSRAQADVDVQTDASGRARLFMTTNANSYTPFAIYRDASHGLGAVTVTVTANATPAELATAMAPGSAGVVVPRDNTLPGVNIGDPIPAPTLLVGDAARTNIYVQLENTGPRASAQYDVGWLIDGTSAANFDFGTAAANSGLIGNVAGAFYLRGGRHTVGEFVDSGNNNAELDETNNRWAAQWIWAPSTLGIGSSIVRSAPPAANGGWSDIPVGVQARLNVDAVRTPAFSAGNGQYAAMAILPFAASDHDLLLYDLSTGPENGFTSGLTASTWGPGVSDYVLANFGQTAPRAFDVAVQRYSGTDAYRVAVVQSTDIGAAPVNPHVATMTSTQLIHLYEIDLLAEEIEIQLENLSGNVNWGFTVHMPTLAFGSKNSTLGAVDYAGAGQNEGENFLLPVAGHYAIAVWKSGSADEGQTGQYALKVFRAALTDTPSAELPTRSGIASVQPNPFNPRTSIAFDVAKPGPVTVELFDLAGHRVRTLVQRSYDSGSYSATWDGLDDGGRQVASGVYFVRLNSAGAMDQRKILLLK